MTRILGAVREALLMIVDAIEKELAIEPRTSECRKHLKKSRNTL